MIKALAIIFLILGWFTLLNTPILKRMEKDKDAKRSMLFLAIGTILVFISFFN